MVTVASVIALAVVLAPLVALVASSVTIWAMWRLGMSRLIAPADKVTKHAGRFSRILKGLGRALMWVGLKALPVVGKAILWIGRALMANPIGLAVMAIAGGAYLIIKYWEPLKGIFDKIWSGIKDGALWLGNFIIEWSPLGLLIKGVQKLKGLMKGFWGDKDNKVAIEATKHIKQLPANDPYYRSSIKPIGKNTAADKGASSSDQYKPLRSSASITTKEIHSSEPTVINIHAAEGMNLEELATMVDKKIEEKDRKAERRRRGRLHG
jgi:phage-related tail protein